MQFPGLGRALRAKVCKICANIGKYSEVEQIADDEEHAKNFPFPPNRWKVFRTAQDISVPDFLLRTISGNFHPKINPTEDKKPV